MRASFKQLLGCADTVPATLMFAAALGLWAMLAVASGDAGAVSFLMSIDEPTLADRLRKSQLSHPKVAAMDPRMALPGAAPPIAPAPRAMLIPNWEVGRRADMLIPNYIEGMGKLVFVEEQGDTRFAEPPILSPAPMNATDRQPFPYPQVAYPATATESPRDR